MNGLQTQQRTSFAQLYRITAGVGGTQLSQSFVFNPRSASQMNQMIPEMASNPEAQIWIKRLVERAFYFNGSQWPIYTEILKFRARKDLYQTSIYGLLGTDAPSPNSPYASFTTGDDFRKYLKIVSSKRIFWKPATMLRVRSSYKRFNKPYIGGVEGDTGYTFRKGDIITYIRWTGVPIAHLVPAGNVSTCLSPLCINGVVHQYASYYLMGDVAPISNLVSTIPSTLANTNTALNPTWVTTAQSYNTQNDPTNELIAPTAVTELY